MVARINWAIVCAVVVELAVAIEWAAASWDVVMVMLQIAAAAAGDLVAAEVAAAVVVASSPAAATASEVALESVVESMSFAAVAS